MTTYNPILISKLLNLAGHPGTPDGEALNSVRKAHSHCSSKSMMLGDVANFVNGPIYVDIVSLPNKGLLSEIADLQIALDDAQARIAALETEVASLNETVARQQDALAAASAVASAVAMDPVGEPATTVIEEPIIERTVRRRAAAKRTTSTGVRRSARMTTSEVDEPSANPSMETPQPDASVNTRPWSLNEWVRFNVLAALGRATSSIARTLSREFGRLVTTACVGEMRRERWLSPGYGLA